MVKRRLSLLLLASLLGHGCGGSGGVLSGAVGRDGASSKAKRATRTSEANEGAREKGALESDAGTASARGSTPGAASGSSEAGPPPTATPPAAFTSAARVACAWGAMVTDDQVTIVCELLAADGTPLPFNAGDLPFNVTWEVKGADGAARAVTVTDAPGGAGLLGIGSFFKKVIQAPVRTIVGDVLNIKMLGPLAGLADKVITLSFLDGMPGLKGAVQVAQCLTTSAFPVFCLAAAGIGLINKIPGGGGGIARGNLGILGPAGSVHSLWNGRFHAYAFDPVPLVNAGYNNEGALFRVLQAPLPETHALHLCKKPNGAFFVSISACEGYPVIGPLGWISVKPKPHSVELFRCYHHGIQDHLVATAEAVCVQNGYQVEGRIGWAPAPGYVH